MYACLLWEVDCVRRWGGQVFIVTLGYEDFGWNINKYYADAYLYLVRESGSFVGGFGGQIISVRRR